MATVYKIKPITIISIQIIGAREMVQCLKKCTILEEDPSLDPSNQMGQLTTTYTSNLHSIRSIPLLVSSGNFIHQ